MQTIIMLLTLMVNQQAQSQTLAPHPVYFSVTGRPSSIQVPTKDGLYTVTWDGTTLGLVKNGWENNGWHNHNNGPIETSTDGEFGCLGCFFLLLSAGWMAGVIYLGICGEFKLAASVFGLSIALFCFLIAWFKWQSRE